jgi:peptidyl-prolyl cis-trans isomerase SurA
MKTLIQVKIYSLKKKLFFAILMVLAQNVYSQKFKTNNIARYDSASAIIEINKLYKMLLTSDNLGEIATKYTQDPGSFKNNGIIQKLSFDMFDEGFQYHIKNLKIGEISKPFETIFGWHIAKVLEIDSEKKYLIQHVLIMYM